MRSCLSFLLTLFTGFTSMTVTGGTTNISSSDLPGSSWHKYVYRVMSGSDVDQVMIKPKA